MKHMLRCYLLLMFLFSQGVIAADKPNIILIVLDDLGWRDVGFMGNSFIETPQLDKLAAEGLVFDNAYSNAPNCAPSRAAIMSGQYAPRTDVYTMLRTNMGDSRLHRVVTPENKVYLEPRVTTLAEMLKDNGYHTAHIGKWNLGTGDIRGPAGQGFDINIGGSRMGDAHDGYFAPYNLPGLEQAPAGEYLTDRLTNEAIDIIRQKKSQPFFIHLSHFAPHFPLQAPDDLISKYEQKAKQLDKTSPVMNSSYAAMIERVDHGIGQIIEELKNQAIENNTLVIFTSDNGSYRNLSLPDSLRGEKSSMYEGGIRVPLILWWKGHIDPSVSTHPVAGIDIYPTLMYAAGARNISQPLDGKNLAPFFDRSLPAFDRNALYWYFPAYIVGLDDEASDAVFRQRPVAVVRQGEWKLLRFLDSDRIELYNLANDPGESINLADIEIAQRNILYAKLDSWLKDMNVTVPLPLNPDYDPDYEEKYSKSWWRRLRSKLGPFFQESDLE